jgi:Spy/CpxP family protein refolding chaperone
MNNVYLRLIILPLCTFCIFHFTVAQVPADKDALLNGEGAGQAKYAEMNGFPGPKHVLELADTLNLTKEQKESMQKLFDEMAEKAKSLGKKIVELEEQLNDDFEKGTATEASVKRTSVAIGELRGELRAVHLNAHLKAKKILLPQQIELYKSLREIGTTKDEHRHRMHH